MTEKEIKEHQEKVRKLHKKHPNVPTEIFDIEASEEMVGIYQDMFGQ